MAAGRLQGWRRLLFDNVGLKLAALLASLTLFSIVHGAEDAQRSIFVDVVSIPPAPSAGKMLVSEIPDQIKVTLRGSRSQINSLRRDDIEAIQVRLTDTSLRYLYFDPASIEVPAGVSIVQLAPATVPLVWTDAAERSVPISPRIVGRAPDGYAVRLPVEATPSHVVVYGPEADIEAITTVYTEPMDMSGLKPGPHERQVPLERPPQHVTYRRDSVVAVKLDIAPEVGERLFSRLEIEAVGEGAVRLRPAHVNLTLQGKASVLDRIDSEHLVPYVELPSQQLAKGTQPLPVRVRGLPTGVEVVLVEPQDVLVKLRRSVD